MDGNPGDQAAACQDLSGRRTGHTCGKDRFPGFGNLGLVEDGAGMFLAGVQRMKDTEEVGNLSAGKQSPAAVLMVDFEGMDKTCKMKLKNTGRLR